MCMINILECNFGVKFYNFINVIYIVFRILICLVMKVEINIFFDKKSFFVLILIFKILYYY